MRLFIYPADLYWGVHLTQKQLTIQFIAISIRLNGTADYNIRYIEVKEKIITVIARLNNLY